MKMGININVFSIKNLISFFSTLFIFCGNALGQEKLNNQQKKDILEMFISSGDLQKNYKSKYLKGFEGLTSFTLTDSIQCQDQKIEFYRVRLNNSHSLIHVYIKTNDKYLCLSVDPEINLLRPLLSLFSFYMQNGCEIDKDEVSKKISSIYIENTMNRSRTTIYPLAGECITCVAEIKNAYSACVHTVKNKQFHKIKDEHLFVFFNLSGLKQVKMINNDTSCFKCVDGINRCIYCSGKLAKNGFSRVRKQRYKCKGCNKTIVENYTYNAYFSTINNQIILLLTEGLGIRSIARVLQISTTTL